MTRQEAIEILRDTPIAISSSREDDICSLYAMAQNMAIEALKKEPKQRHWVGTPKEFAEKMYQLAESGDAEADHVKADELMCQLLTSLGYGEGVKIFRDMDKWYS